MSGVSNFLRTYDFLHLTRSVNEAQIALHKEPNETWGDISSKFCNICWLNCESIAAVGLDVVTYLAVSTLRGCGLFLPQPPAPPAFPTPHDNVEFVQYAIERALWNWNPALRKEFEEGIDACLSDKWNVFQAIGEWSLAYSFENAEKSSYYKPTFLTISEPLENGESFRSVGQAFDRLKARDRTAILNALYKQEEAPSLNSSGKKVYQNIRALASKLHQGNQIYLSAFGEYRKKKEAGSLRTVPIETPSAYSTRPIITPSISTSADATRPITRPIATSPSYSTRPFTTPAFSTRADVSRSFEPIDSYAPSAPSAPDSFADTNFRLITDDVEFLNSAVMSATNGLDANRKKSVIKSVINDRSRPLLSGYRPESLITWSPEGSPKFFVARLCMLRFFKEGFQKNRFSECPTFIPLNESLRNGKSLRDVGFDFASLSDRDFKLLQDTIAQPLRSRLSGHLKEKLLELSEFADVLHRNEDFLRTYEALRIDLIAN